jgi:galactose-1-phosphate uridylyltransferase
MMYCENCGKTFKDTWTIHNTRTEKVETNCPFCKSNYTMNASKFIEEFESLNGREKFGKYVIKDKQYLLFHNNEYKMLKKKNMIYRAKNKKILIFEDIFYPRRVINHVKNKSC